MAAMSTPAVKRVSRRFASLDDLLADANRIAAAERNGTLARAGNWSAGQTYGHIAGWIDYGYGVAPMAVPLPMRLVARLIRPLVLKRGMIAGVRFPGVASGTFACEPLSLEDGLAHLNRSVDRLRDAPPARPNPLFGPLSAAQWTQLHLRHAELHFSFLVPR